VESAEFNIEISASADDPPLGYLFLCPTDYFRTGPSSFCWPDGPAYWSLDPSGAERLTMNEATALGFPSIRFHTEIMGHIWDSSVYAGTRRFHEAKGFDPESQDLARHLGQSLYQLSSEVDSPFAYGKSSVFQPNPSVRLMVISPKSMTRIFIPKKRCSTLMIPRMCAVQPASKRMVSRWIVGFNLAYDHLRRVKGRRRRRS
jgi:hypothetical protein